MAEHQICLQSLEAYNNSILYFEWYDVRGISNVGKTYEEFRKKCQKDLPQFSHEEIMVADYFDFPNLGEYPGLEDLQEVIDKFNTEPESKAEAICDFISNGNKLNDFDEAYQGHYGSMTDFAEELVDDCYGLDKMMGSLAYYFDYEKFARDLEMGGDYWISDNGNVFRNL